MPERYHKNESSFFRAIHRPMDFNTLEQLERMLSSTHKRAAAVLDEIIALGVRAPVDMRERYERLQVQIDQLQG